ncbi:MAG: efflux RND transporter periplasmic adaptor subunit [Desulfobacterales bacterium]|nr:efflux RND transporter periplasmic adaptor subunit [Desulfobacterales bacterium]
MTQTRKTITQLVIVVALILAGILGVKALLASKPALEKSKPAVSIAIARTVSVKTETKQVVLTGQGTVNPLKEIQLVPQVSGKVVQISPSLVNGGAFHKGDLLLCIDPSDYNIAVTLAAARVKDAESRFKLTQEEASAARQEWSQLHPKSEPPPLVAKEPQLAAARATLDAEKANLKKARLQLERTRLTAPFDGRVSKENVDMGQYVAPGQALASLYSTDAAEIVLPMEDRDLLWFDVPGFTSENPDGSEAEVKAQFVGKERSFPGRVVRSEGKMDERTRMIHVVVRVDNPYAQKPPLAAGLFTTVHIKGHIVENSAIIPRAALRPDSTVWVVDKEGRLEFRKVEIARFSTQGVMIQGGLSNGEDIVISAIKAVSNGMKVRNIPENTEVK